MHCCKNQFDRCNSLKVVFLAIISVVVSTKLVSISIVRSFAFNLLLLPYHGFLLEINNIQSTIQNRCTTILVVFIDLNKLKLVN
jgi:hypothetical protein